MPLPDLNEFCFPDSDRDVVNLLDKYRDEALLVGGGTFVHGLDARGLLDGVQTLINLRKLGLDTIESEKGGVRVGASVTFTDLERMTGIESPGFGALRDALACPPVQIKNMATVAGSIAASCPFFDVPTVFQLLDGVVQIKGVDGERQLHLHEFHTGLFQNTLSANEYITSLFLPNQHNRSASAYLKLETNANDLALVGVAVSFTIGLLGKCSNARVILGGGLSDTVVRSVAAESVLNGAKPSDEVFRQAAESIINDIEPISDHRCSAEYRAEMGKVYTRRALNKALKRLDQEG